jgi:predicted dinucleotide-binding enzyme
MARAQRHPVTSRHTDGRAQGSAGSRPRLVVVGSGPRATGILDRIAANTDLVPPAGLRVDVVDPHVPGAGRIWDAQESPLLLMNSRAADVTMFADESCDLEGPVRQGPSLAQWAQQIREGRIAPPTAGTERLAEITSLSPTDFASRRVQALYLEWVFGLVSARLPDRVELHVHRRRAVDLVRSRRGWDVTMDSGTVLAADRLLVTVGHTDADPTTGSRALQDFARRHDAVYLPPSQARDADLAAVPAGARVIMRGMGLGAVDLLALLTEGRGGRFVPAPSGDRTERLEYRPSGEEPEIWIGSHRGTPYHSKVRDEAAPAGPGDLVHLTPQALDDVADEDGLVDVERDVVPLIAREIRRAVPGVDLGADPSAARTQDPPLGWSLLGPLDDPLARTVADWQHPDTDPAARTRETLVSYIQQDLHARRGPDNDRARALFQVLLRLTGALTRLLPSSRITPSSRQIHPSLWHSLFSFVCSGPPPHRLHQMLALERAGVLHFLGPRLEVAACEDRGTFRARAAGGVELECRVLIDAFLPRSTLLGATDPFLAGLAAQVGAGRGHADPSSPGAGTPTASGLLDTAPTGKVLGPDRSPLPGLWAAGPGTSEIPLGAFARPGTDAPVFRMNDLLARDLLTGIERGEGASVTDDRAPRPAGSGNTPSDPRVGVIGAGKIGTAIARQSVRSGLEVQVHSRQDPRTVRARIPAAAAGVPGPAADAAGTARPDVLVLALPLHAVLAMDRDRCSGGVVIDATNPWGPEDTAALERARASYGPVLPDGGAHASSSELVAVHLRGARVVKALNHIGYHDLEDQARRPGARGRRALAVAGDDAGARELAARFIDRLGFDPVQVDGLGQARHLEPDGAVFGTVRGREDLSTVLRDARAQVLFGA